MKKRFLSFMLVFSILVTLTVVLPTTVSAASSGTCGENLTWTLDDSGTLTISGSGKMADWTSFDKVPWWNDDITSVIIGDSVTSIGSCAFEYCRSLTSVTIPDSVTSIKDRAFADCDSLSSVTIGNSVTSIGDYAFHFCLSLTSVIIPNSVTSIGSYAFECCDSLTSVTIPDSVTSIADSAFADCSRLTSITIPDSVTRIGDHVFSGCGRLNISVNTGNKNYSSMDGVLFNKNQTEIIAYAKDNNVPSYTISDSVTSIGDGAFYGCSRLTSVTIPDSVTSIGDGAFYNCSSLTSVTIPDRVTSVGDYAFYCCRSLISVEIPNSVIKIGDSAFRFCDSLTSMTIPDSVTSIGADAFGVCGSFTSVTIGDSVTSIGDYAFYFCNSLTSVTIPNSVTSIGYRTFWGCSRLKDVYYGGTEAQWNQIKIDADNSYLENANIHYHTGSDGEVSVQLLYDYDKTNRKITVTAENLCENASLSVAEYDGKNRLIGLKPYSASADKNSIEHTIFTNPSIVKVFLWDAMPSMSPVTQAITIDF